MQLVAPIVERIKPVAQHADDKNLNDRAKANTGWVTSPNIALVLRDAWKLRTQTGDLSVW